MEINKNSRIKNEKDKYDKDEYKNSKKTITKSLFIRILITSLIISAIISIITFLIGEFQEFEIRIITTTMIFSWFSLLNLTYIIIKEINKHYKLLSIISMIFSTIILIISLLNLWEIIYINTSFIYKSNLICFALAHISLLLFIKIKNKFSKISLIITIISIIILTLYGIIPDEINYNLFTNPLTIRIIGVLIIIDILGSILTPTINKIKIK